MPLQNRVTPSGEIIATPARGTLMGNRGILHGETRQLGTARWRHKAWITCRLEFKGRHRRVMTPNRYTELFFLDEYVALAAGHRPCAECRRADFKAYRDALGLPEKPSAPQIDALLHRDRVRRDRSQVRFQAELGNLPDGVFVMWKDAPHLKLRGKLHRYSSAGYTDAIDLSIATVNVLTPRLSVTALRNGFA